MKNFILKLLAVLLASVLFTDCKKPKTYPAIPTIEFKSLVSQRSISGKDSVSIITISFTDGDGDIGYHSTGNGALFDDTASAYYNDFIVSFFQKKNGVWVEDSLLEHYPYPGFSGRLPYLTPDGDNKALQGDVSMNQYIQFFPVQNDTIRYEVYIYDRALHKSNTITTSELVISTY